jgi:hypothetical protein
MAITTINVGNAPNDGSGDSIRAAFTKANDNFTYLQSIIGNLATTGTTGLTVTGPVSINTLGSTGRLVGTFLLNGSEIATTSQTFSGGTVSGVTNFTNATDSVSINTGAVTVAGGIGVAGTATIGAAIVQGNLSVNNVNLTAAGQFTLPDGSPFAFDVFANAALQATSLATLTANAALQEANLAIMVSNASLQQSSLDTIRANVGAYQLYANAVIQPLDGNVAAYQTWANAVIKPLDSNVALYQTYANANIGTLFLGNLSTNANLGAYQIWANANLAIANISISNRANIASPEFTGEPKSVTFLPGVSNTTIATTAFVFEANAGLAANVAANLQLIRTDLTTNYATISSPGFTGVPTADQAAPGSNTNQLANTSFVFEANTGSIAFMLDRLQANNISHSANITAANVEISSLQANVTAANLSIGSLQANITAANVEISSLQSNVTAANVEISSLQANITAANTTVSDYAIWANANISAQSYNPIFYGESLTITNGNISALGGNTTVWRTIDTVNNTQVPTTGTGAAGDIPGIIAYDPNATTLLICHKAYDGIATIWGNVSLSAFT